MEQEIRRPDYEPRKHDRTSSTLNCALAAVGVTLMTLCLVGAAAVTAVWAFGTLFDVGLGTFKILAVIAMLPVIAISAWTAGRAWHIERRLARGQDVDSPVYSLTYYFRKSA